MRFDDLGNSFDGHDHWTPAEIDAATKLARKLGRRDKICTHYSDDDTGFFIGPKNVADDDCEKFIKIEKTFCDAKRRELHRPTGDDKLYVITNGRDQTVKEFKGKVLDGFYLITPSKWKDADGGDAYCGIAHSNCIFLSLEEAVRAAYIAYDALQRGLRWGEDDE